MEQKKTKCFEDPQTRAEQLVDPESIQSRGAWELNRTVSLAEAIGRHANAGLLLKHSKRVSNWAIELTEHLEHYGLQYRKDMAEQEEAEADEETREQLPQEEGQG